MQILRTLLFTAIALSLCSVSVYAQGTQTIPEIEGVVVTDEKPAATQESQEKVEEEKTQKTKRSVPGVVPAWTHFMRVKKSAKRKPLAFETSVTRYLAKNNDGDTVYVDLIGVVHIGERKYYEQLNDIFENYDSVLYELVAPEGTVIPKGGGGRAEGFNPIASLQMGMQQMLGLEFQLEHINYEKNNFRHADMSPTEFLESMKNNDESFAKIMVKAVGQSIAQSGQTQVSNFDLLRVAFARDKEIKMRQLFAKQMIDMEGGMAIFEGRDGSTIINHRNGKAMEILEDVLDSGKKKVAIFYGAGHLPDMERRLMSDFRMKRGGQYWLEAWKLKR